MRLVTTGVGETSVICSHLAAFLGVDTDDQLTALVHETLEKLEAVKLIERDVE